MKTIEAIEIEQHDFLPDSQWLNWQNAVVSSVREASATANIIIFQGEIVKNRYGRTTAKIENLRERFRPAPAPTHYPPRPPRPKQSGPIIKSYIEIFPGKIVKTSAIDELEECPDGENRHGLVFHGRYMKISKEKYDELKAMFGVENEKATVCNNEGTP